MASAEEEIGPPKRLLSLDGGGIKGISSLLILQAIMLKVQELEPQSAVVDQTKSSPSAAGTDHTSKSNEPKPLDYFDLTGGTSTGGLIAVMLGRLGMTCQDAIDNWSPIAEQIFAIRFLGINFSKYRLLRVFGPLVLKVKLLFGSQFDAKYLDQQVDFILQKYLPHESDQEPKLVAKQYNPHDVKGKMFMCATMADQGHALLFRDYTPPPDSIPESTDTGKPRHPRASSLANPYTTSVTAAHLSTPIEDIIRHLQKFDYDSVTIKDAVRATSAAPTYLPPKEIQKIQFWDGGMLNNNPVDEVWAARYDLAPTEHTEPYVSTVVSIGTTWNTPSTANPMGLIARLLSIVTKSINFATNTEAKHLDFQRNIYRRNFRQRKDQKTAYFRFNAPVGETSIDLADFRKIDFLKTKTREFLALDDTKRQIEKCAKILLGERVSE